MTANQSVREECSSDWNDDEKRWKQIVRHIVGWNQIDETFVFSKTSSSCLASTSGTGLHSIWSIFSLRVFLFVRFYYQVSSFEGKSHCFWRYSTFSSTTIWTMSFDNVLGNPKDYLSFFWKKEKNPKHFLVPLVKTLKIVSFFGSFNVLKTLLETMSNLSRLEIVMRSCFINDDLSSNLAVVQMSPSSSENVEFLVRTNKHRSFVQCEWNTHTPDRYSLIRFSTLP